MSDTEQTPSATPIWTGRAILGEGPMWSPGRGRLFFVDILGHRILSCGLAGEAVAEWQLEESPCWIVEQAGGEDFVVGLGRSVVVMRLTPGEPAVVRHVVTEPGLLPPGMRLNDAKADAEGRIYFGAMDDAEVEATGQLHLLGLDGTVTVLDQGYTVTNGPAISPDGRTLYHADSPARTVYAFDRRPDGGLTGKRVHIRLTEAEGYPDGMTVDAEGGLWVCHWDGGRVTRFTPDGARDRTIPLPASRVTSCAFCGPDLDRLAITTAAHERMEEPLAGALFLAQPGLLGLAPHRARLAV
ncbi:MAG TPA: SMP-30/gluconolactonase/LRE family protein [Acidisoma sp.]|uniref:SMP-30/gluconolactonase/LRE family protein n=1 Tax=Acidisoma sp. TaxID=1872115 RepID=UPI002CFBF3F3|nr:SMP-30/gluconolactonase/LRE family protein [Acidisoma sp.]HTI01043.1 SMP-30/gluconolactonase/LRE family protein [Acidisoma sp.]